MDVWVSVRTDGRVHDWMCGRMNVCWLIVSSSTGSGVD